MCDLTMDGREFGNCKACGRLVRMVKLRYNGCTTCLSVSACQPDQNGSQNTWSREDLTVYVEAMEFGILTCTRCGQRLPLSAFDVVPGRFPTRLGRSSRCKPCRREYDRDYRAAQKART